MKDAATKRLDRDHDVLRLEPRLVGRFYDDANRLGQRSARAGKPRYYRPERWIGSSTMAVNPKGIPSGGVSSWADAPASGPKLLPDLLKDAEHGPRLLGEKRFRKHEGELRLLVKLLDAGIPIPFHVHAGDKFVADHPNVYPDQRFGKDEAYHFLTAPKGPQPYTHIGLHKGVRARDIVEQMERGVDYVLETSPAVYQAYGCGFYTRAGLMHRPGTALTLEVQQPSDVCTLFQKELGNVTLSAADRHPGFADAMKAISVIDFRLNHDPKLVETYSLRPTKVKGKSPRGGKIEWIYPPEMTDKFSGQRLTIDKTIRFTADDPCMLFVWSGKGKLDGRAIRGSEGAGRVGKDEFYLGVNAVERGVAIENGGDEPLIAFAIFPQKV